MESGALSTAEFTEFGSEYVLFLHVTSHIEGDAYQNLLSEKGGGGFPYLVAMDAEGNVIAQHSGPRTVEGFQATMESGEEFLALMASEDLSPEKSLDLFHKRLALGHFDLEQARAEAAKLTALSAEAQAKIDAALLGLEIKQHAPATRDGVPAAGKAYAKMYAEGKVPAQGREYEMYFFCILEHAFQSGDAALFEDALGKMREMFGDNPRAANFFTAQEKRLEELKAKNGGGDK